MGATQYYYGDLPMMPSIKVGSANDVVIAFVSGSTNISVHPTKFRPVLDSVCNRCDALGTEPGAVPMPEEDIKVGLLCNSKYDDGNWYRSLINEVDYVQKRALLFFVDYGNSDYVSFENILPLDGSLLMYPIQALSVQPDPSVSVFTEQELEDICVDVRPLLMKITKRLANGGDDREETIAGSPTHEAILTLIAEPILAKCSSEDEMDGQRKNSGEEEQSVKVDLPKVPLVTVELIAAKAAPASATVPTVVREEAPVKMERSVSPKQFVTVDATPKEKTVTLPPIKEETKNTMDKTVITYNAGHSSAPMAESVGQLGEKFVEVKIVEKPNQMEIPVNDYIPPNQMFTDGYQLIQENKIVCGELLEFRQTAGQDIGLLKESIASLTRQFEQIPQYPPPMNVDRVRREVESSLVTVRHEMRTLERTVTGVNDQVTMLTDQMARLAGRIESISIDTGKEIEAIKSDKSRQDDLVPLLLSSLRSKDELIDRMLKEKVEEKERTDKAINELKVKIAIRAITQTQ